MAWIVFEVSVSCAADYPLLVQAGNSAAGGTPIYREPGSATSKFYCNDRIVEPGDTMAGVIEKCGEPVRKVPRTEERLEAVTPEGSFVTRLSTEEWTYNFGPDRLLYYLKFRDDILVEIRTGGYGY